MNESQPNGPRAAVLRVMHDVNRAGHVIRVGLEPVPGASTDDVVFAAWQAARRRHPWIVGGKAAEQLEAVKRIALVQVSHLMNAADEALLAVAGVEHESFDRLRSAVIDLRGYLPALHGEIPRPEQRAIVIWRRAG
jgi:hypothetical protein